MFRLIFASILLIILFTNVRCQFYDFFSAFQPLVHTTRSHHYDVTTKRPKPHSRQNTAKIIDNISKLSFNIDDLNTNRDREKQHPQIFHDSTTVKTARKTTKHVTSSQNHDSRIRNKTPKDTNTMKINRDRLENARTDNSRRFNQANSNDEVIFEDGKRNTVISYETTRRYQEYDKKVHQTTQYPYTVRPGVRPVTFNGPPITNKPATQRPSFDPKPVEDDISVSPELIIGPDEDYMTNVEKRRYVEMAEKMCDKYKALDNKQIQAIPLLPSPDVVKLNVSTCTPSTVPLVVGGKVVTVDEFPHMALLGWTKLKYGGYSWKCGGSLLSNRYVLTAAHCAYQERDNTVVTGAPRAVQLGSSYLDGQNAVIIKVAAVIRHPKYKLPKSYYDLAIVKMASTVTFSKVVKPACLGTPPPPGQPIIATGWGRTEFSGDQSEELRSVSIPVWDMDECYNVLGTSRKIPDGPSSESQICAGEKRGGKDTCLGDSGGPAQIQDGCAWRVVAVTSLGRSCGAPHTPALYAKVQKAFISAVIFGDQIKNKPTQTNQQNNSPWINNQHTYSDGNNKQQNFYNSESNSRDLSNNRKGSDDLSDNVNSYQTNNRHRQNSNGQNYNNNNNDYTTVRPSYNNPRSNNNDYTTARPTYNNHRSNNNDYTTVRPVYSNPKSYSNDDTAARPVYSNRKSYNNDYTTARPVYNNPQSYNNDYDNVPDYQADNPYYTGSRTWWS